MAPARLEKETGQQPQGCGLIWSRRKVIALTAAIAVVGPREALASDEVVGVVMTTASGSVEMAIEVGKAPLSAKQFLAYVDSKAFDGALFHRSVHSDRDPAPVKIEILQAAVRHDARMGPIEHEPTILTGLRHLDGTISVARREVGTGNAGDFFICIGDQPELDYRGLRNADGEGFAAFGRVTQGMEVIRKIWSGKTVASKLAPQVADRLVSPITIVSIRRHM